MRLVTQFQRFRDEFSPTLFREFVRQVEQVFARIEVDTTVSEKLITAATYTTQREDFLILCDTTSNSITVTLDTITDNMIRDKREFIVSKKVDANSLTLTPSGSDTVLGDASVVLSTANSVLHLRATTQGWVAL